MFKKKYFLVLMILTVSICAISSVSATDEGMTMDPVESDVETLAIGEENVENQEISENGEDSILSQSESEEVHSASVTPSSYYSLNLEDTYEISATKDTKIAYYLNPCQDTRYKGYNFNFVGFDKDYNVVYDYGLLSSDTNRQARIYQPTIKANSFLPGTYYLAAVNYGDNKVMDVAVLKVSGDAKVTVGDYSAYYASGKTITAKITDSVHSKPINGVDVKVTFTKNGKTQTKTYTSDVNGVIKITPPASVGTYSLTIASATPHVKMSEVKRTANVRKAPVSIKAYRVSEYKGFKVTLKATVKSQGKKVNEGKVTFKINGKTYNVKVKNGVATKRLKLKKVKKYTYFARFTASNFKTSKKVSSKAIIKKRLDTKIVIKDQRIYMNDAKVFTIKVLTKSGKKVKDGKLKIRGVGTVDVKNGKAKVVKYGLGIKHLKKINGRTEYFKKTVSKKFKLKYVPTSHKYKASTKKLKITSVFKCPGCGNTHTHNHYAVGYYLVYKTRIVVS